MKTERNKEDAGECLLAPEKVILKYVVKRCMMQCKENMADPGCNILN